MKVITSRFALAFRFLMILWQRHSFKEAFIFCRYKSSTNQNLRSEFLILGDFILHRTSNNRLHREAIKIFSNDLQQLNFYAQKVYFTASNAESVEIKIKINLETVTIILKNKEEVALFYEIFFIKPYSFHINNECVVVDVGMNIGFASIFFSAQSNVKKVYAYELIPSTFKIAERNIGMNKFAQSKVIPHAYGISNKTEDIHIPMAHEGSVGASVVDFIINSENSFTNSLKVKCRNIQEIINDILYSNSLPIVLKLDCEGAEYAILEELDKSKQLNDLSIVMIEWHQKGAETLLSILKNNGFSCFDFLSPTHSDIGFVYAVRN